MDATVTEGHHGADPISRSGTFAPAERNPELRVAFLTMSVYSEDMNTATTTSAHTLTANQIAAVAKAITAGKIRWEQARSAEGQIVEIHTGIVAVGAKLIQVTRSLDRSTTAPAGYLASIECIASGRRSYGPSVRVA
jgi:hypothetical protein